MNVIKEKQTHKYREKLVVTSWDRKEEVHDRAKWLRGTNLYVENRL